MLSDDRIPLLIEARLSALIAELQRLSAGWLDSPHTLSHVIAGVPVTLLIGHGQGGAERGLPASMREVIEWARAELAGGRRMLGREMYDAFLSSGRRLAKSTFSAALAELAATGRLINDADRRGYSLPDGD